MKFAICNLGCKVNNYESNWYRQQLSKQYQEVDFKEFSDIYIINSCTVTNMAGSKTTAGLSGGTGRPRAPWREVRPLRAPPRRTGDGMISTCNRNERNEPKVD